MPNLYHVMVIYIYIFHIVILVVF